MQLGGSNPSWLGTVVGGQVHCCASGNLGCLAHLGPTDPDRMLYCTDSIAYFWGGWREWVAFVVTLPPPQFRQRPNFGGGFYHHEEVWLECTSQYEAHFSSLYIDFKLWPGVTAGFKVDMIQHNLSTLVLGECPMSRFLSREIFDQFHPSSAELSWAYRYLLHNNYKLFCFYQHRWSRIHVVALKKKM